MPSRRTWPIVLLVSSSIWMLFLTFYVLIYLAEGSLPPDLMQRFVAYLGSVAVTFLAGTAAIAVLRGRMRGRWAVFVALSVLTLALHAFFAAAIYKLAPLSDSWGSLPYLALVAQGLLWASPLVASGFIAFAALYFGQESARRERQLAETRAAATKAQIATLRYQLNPHFLFNTLNSLSALILDQRTKEAEETIVRLSSFLRRSIDGEPNALVPLDDELQTARDYLAIERTRFGDRLKSAVGRDEAAAQCFVPAFILQPIIENAVKHAVGRVTRPVRVEVGARLVGNLMELSVSDDGPGVLLEANHRNGIGIQNTKERLELIYGPKASAELVPREPSGVRVLLTIPRHEASC